MKILGKSPRLQVHVNDDVIKDAIERDSSHCMIAVALRKKYPWAKYVSVDIQTIRLTDVEKKERYVFLTPRSVQEAIIKFDQGIRPKGFNFGLRSGQTLEMNTYNRGKTKNIKTRKTTTKKSRKNKKAVKFRNPVGGAGNRRGVPEISGGYPPPIAAGRRRAFGLRGFEF